jgi:DNA ligase-1
MNYNLKPIRPMLACSDTILTDDNYDKIVYPVIASTKLDGWRSIIDVNNNPLSRSGKSIPNLFTRKEIHSADLAGWDGEILASSPTDPNAMQKAQSAFSSIHGEPDFTYHIFDNWQRQKLSFKNYWDRIQNIDLNLPEWAELIPQLYITSPEELAEFVKEVTSQGYEGAVIRSLNSPYKHGRSTWNQSWMLKAKPYTYEEGIITSLNERMINYNPKQMDELGFSRRSTHKGGKVPGNTLGSFNIRNKDGLIFSIGTGHLNEAERQQVWDTRDTGGTWVGKLITFKHFAQSGVRDKPRHGQFVTLRSVEDL